MTFARHAALGLVLLGGCNRIFGIKETAEIDAMPSGLDAPDAFMADALPAGCMATTYLAEADTYLADASAHGIEDALLVTSNHPALFRFEISSLGSNHFAAFVLHVAVVPDALACGASCGACTNTATKYQLYWNTGDWSATEATSADSRTSSAWDIPFAKGSGDRSAKIAEHPLPATSGTIALVAHMTEVAVVPWNPTFMHVNSSGLETVSIQLLTDQPLALSSDDRADGGCADIPGEAALDLTVCP